MADYEIPVVSDGDHVVDMLNAVKLMTQLTDGTTSGQFNSILATVGMVGLIVILINLVLRGNLQSLVQWLIAYTLVFGVLFVPKVDVIVNDRSDPTVATNPVENVPLGVGMLAWITTSFGDRVATSLETIMSPVDTVSYQGGNMLWGQKVMTEMPGMRFTDARIADNMNKYLRACVFPTIAADPMEMQTIKQSTDLWAHLASNAPNTRITEYTTSSGTTSFLSCKAASLLITPELSQQAQDAMTFYGQRLYPDKDGTDAATALKTDLGLLHDTFIGVSRDGGEMLKQVMMLNQFEAGLQGYATDSASASLMNFVNSRSETQSRLTMSGLGNIMQTAMPRLYILMFIVLIALFPFIVAIGLLPGIGFSVVKNYAFGFVYLQAFPVLFIIINRIIVVENAKLSEAAAKNVTGSGISFQNMGILSEIPSETSAMAAVMLTLVPVLAGIFTKGIATLGGQMENILRPMHVATEAAAQEAATGNIAVQSANINTSQMDSAGRYQVNQSPMVDTTMALHRNEDGVVQGFSSGGKLHTRVEEAQSSMMMNPTSHAGFVNTLSRNRSQAASEEQTAGRAYTDALEQTDGQAFQLAMHSASGADLRKEIGFNQSDEVGANLSAFDDEVQSFADRNNISKEDALEVFAEAQAGPWTPFASASVGGRGSLTGVHAQNADLVSQASSQIQASESLANLRSSLLSSSDTTSLSKSTEFGDSLMNSLNETRTASQNLQSLSARRQVLENMEQDARSTDASVMANLSQPMMNYMQGKYGDDLALSYASDISFTPEAMAAQSEAAEYVTQQALDNVMSSTFADPRTGQIAPGNIPSIDTLFAEAGSGFGGDTRDWQASSYAAQGPVDSQQWDPNFKRDLQDNRQAVRNSSVGVATDPDRSISFTDEGDLSRQLSTPEDLARGRSDALFEDTMAQRGAETFGEAVDQGSSMMPFGSNMALNAGFLMARAKLGSGEDGNGEEPQQPGPPPHSELVRSN